MPDFIDPFGTQDIFCNDFAYMQMAGPGLIRFVLFAQDGQDGEEKIIKAKILLPALVIPSAIARTTMFLSAQAIDRLSAPFERLVGVH